MGFFTKGCEGRIGTDAKPSWALRDRHVRAFDSFFDHNYRAATTPAGKRHWARAGLANLLLWLGWLRARELFDLRGLDITVVLPVDGPTWDLPPNVGALLLRLNPETKTSRTATADVPVGFTTCSGYRPGRWLLRLKRWRMSAIPLEEDPRPLFQSVFRPPGKAR